VCLVCFRQGRQYFISSSLCGVLVRLRDV